MRRIGVTGTQRGMTASQMRRANTALQDLEPSELHHGDCIGADADIHALALSLFIPIFIHPPINPVKRAFCDGYQVEILPQYDYKIRNGHIVDESDLLIAFPGQMNEHQRSGTWATVRIARRKGIPILIIYPDGSMKLEQP